MKDIQDRLINNSQTLYSAVEMNEVLLMIYNTLLIAFSANADVLIVKPLQILCVDKEGNSIYDFTSELTEDQRISNIDVFDLIWSKDSIVRERFELVARDESGVIYKIT